MAPKHGKRDVGERSLIRNPLRRPLCVSPSKRVNECASHRRSTYLRMELVQAVAEDRGDGAGRSGVFAWQLAEAKGVGRIRCCAAAVMPS